MSKSCPVIDAQLAVNFERDVRSIEAFGIENGLQRPYMSAFDVLRAHYVVVDFCLTEKIGEGIGGIGPRDLNLFLSATDRQFVEFEGIKKWNDIHHLTATLVFGLVKDHPFHDANKRTALLCMVYNLYKNGYFLEIDNYDKNETEELLVRLADNKLHLYDDFEELKSKPDAEVEFLARYMKKHSRKADKQLYIITYRELKTKLEKYGFTLEHPHKNYIDVTKLRTNSERVLHIGFPGWSRQISKGDIKKILDATKLTADHGIDSQVFFYDDDPIYYLTSDYRSQIFSLASR